MPSFAVGRTQTILWYMQKFFIEKGTIPPIPVFVDSPMGVEVSKVHSQFRDNYDEQTAARSASRSCLAIERGLCQLDAGEQEDQRRSGAVRDHRLEPDVRVRPNPASPDAQRGAAERHGRLRRLDAAEHAGPAVAGWAEAGADFRPLVRRAVPGAHDPRPELPHADPQELLKFLAPTIRKETQSYIVHGEADQAEVFAERLIRKGVVRATVPAMETSFIADAVSAAGNVVATRGTAATDE